MDPCLDAGLNDLPAEERLDVGPELGEVLGPAGRLVLLEFGGDERLGDRRVHGLVGAFQTRTGSRPGRSGF